MSDIINFQYSDPKLYHGNSADENYARFKVTQFYINNTSDDIVVVLRNNLPIHCSKHSASISGSTYFTIRTIYQFSNTDSIINTINNITETLIAYGDNEDLKIIKEVLLKDYNHDRLCSNSKISIDRHVSVKDIKEKGVLYIPDTDTLLSYGHVDLTKPHPFSKNGQAISEYHKLAHDRKVTGVFVEVVDNENNIDKRYMYVAKKVLEVPVIRDPAKESGVYFTTATNNRFNDVHIKPEFYSFEEAETQLGLYKTQEEAKTGGNPENVSKAYMLDLERKLAEAKHNQNIDKIEKERIISELNSEVELLKAKAIKAKQKADANKSKRDDYYDSRSKQRSDHYEDRTYTRKDTHELIKYIPGIVLGIIGGIAYVQSKK